ncbi:MAG: effector binding domain-containing protein [Flavobacteriaceae bacterium]|nr:effector binding domain-containing protein [Flavobacteriaceae bacterium]
MKTFKFIFLLILTLIVLGSIYLATIDGSYDVKQSRVIGVQPEVVYNDLNDFKNWQEWGPWYEEDSTIIASFPEKTIGEGASYSWTSKDGDGEIRTIKVDKPKRLDQEIIFKTPFGDMKSDVYWIIEKVKEGTNLTWGMKGEMGFFTRWMAASMEEKMGPMEERGLELFDENIQKKTKIYSIHTNGVVDYSGGFYLYATTSSRIDEVGDKFPGLMMKLRTFIKKNNVRTTGGSFTLYHKYDEENGTTMFSVAYPISEKMLTPSGTDIVSGFMKRGKYFKTTLKGGYENSQEAWETAMKEVGKLTDYKMIEKGEPFELYVNSPMKIANPADLISEIYIPVEKILVVKSN